jgi:hypothetical protein
MPLLTPPGSLDRLPLPELLHRRMASVYCPVIYLFQVGFVYKTPHVSAIMFFQAGFSYKILQIFQADCLITAVLPSISLEQSLLSLY